MEKLRRKGFAIVTGGVRRHGPCLRAAACAAAPAVAINRNRSWCRFRYGEALTAAGVMEDQGALEGRSIGIQADLSQQKQAADAIDKVARELAASTILVNNNAGRAFTVDRFAAFVRLLLVRTRRTVFCL